MKCLLLTLSPVVATVLYIIYFIYLSSPPPLPKLDEKAWWGPGSLRGKQDTSVRPFKIKFDEEMVQDLKTRLRNSRSFSPPLEGVGFQYGFNTEELISWIQYWAEEYNFTERENGMNKYEQFKTNVQGLDIHFLRIKPKVPPEVEILPMLILHGWPGSVREFYETIPHLTALSEDRDFALELIIPSLPGYGYSDPAVRPGLGAAEIAVVMRNLMRRLGHQQFYLQGGDWGYVISSILVTLYPKEVLGFHANLPVIPTSRKSALMMAIFSFFPTLIMDSDVVDRLYPLKKTAAFFLEESGYFHLQATKPDTIGVALSDSPAALLAYIVEKFSAGVNPAYKTLPDGGLGLHFTKDQLLDNLMMYWAPNTGITSGRIYAEYVNARNIEAQWDDIPSDVPTWALQAKYEITYSPPAILRLKYRNLLGATVLHEGGHFLAFELPGVFSEDVLNAVKEFRRFRKEKTEL